MEHPLLLQESIDCQGKFQFQNYRFLQQLCLQILGLWQNSQSAEPPQVSGTSVMTAGAILTFLALALGIQRQ